MRTKSPLAKTAKNRAFLAKNGVKSAQNQTFPFVKNFLKITVSQNFPKIFHISFVILIFVVDLTDYTNKSI
ncbi:MAG: hypothetical protein K2N23_05460, partial [Clostridia bacterium]|nr:hypothetical protein [Clostridia bacterium]